MQLMPRELVQLPPELVEQVAYLPSPPSEHLTTYIYFFVYISFLLAIYV